MSRRSMSVTHARGRGELEDTSPSRLSKVMSQKDLAIDQKVLTMQPRKPSVSSMKNNRLLDRKTSMLS